ncbi:sigma-70 family RNA polymerase sigma factor [Bacillus salitolerans]|uniref:Sigma-70 family RNA polymerase sigma factor n=1 Tax=Bacillus salitolerans TaxID=1437434 RepID=A0ABW4LSY9_9BACI
MYNELREGSMDHKEKKSHVSEEVLVEFYPRLRQYCHFLTQSSWDGEDLAQEALLKVWKKYGSNEDVTSSLLNKVAHNHWVDTLRKRGKETVERVPEKALDEMIQVDNRDETIQLLLNILTPKQVIMFTLKEGFQYQLSEIADLLQTTETAVKATIHRAKQKLEKRESLNRNPLVDQYWDNEERGRIETVVHEALTRQDPTIIIKSIPSIHSLKKEHTNPIFSMHKLRHFTSPSSFARMAA